MGLVVALSMLSIVVVANLIGILLPFVLTRLRRAPAVASSPLITTLVDAAGLLVYFYIATLVLGELSPPDPENAVQAIREVLSQGIVSVR